MGLDMYLTGEKYFMANGKDAKPEVIEEGYRLKAKNFELGYWRKHPSLHGYIVETFANSVDECQRVELGVNCLKTILKAVKGETLPETSGFFFGENQNADDQDTVEQITKAIKWLETEEPGVWRSVIYQASW